MSLPVTPISKPAVLAGQVNGKLGPAILVATEGQAGGPIVTLVLPAARAWRALCAAALAAGHVLKATSPVDSYRPYSVQERIFLTRYTTTPVPGAVPRDWNGQRWYLKPGYAAAAVPGTSNHGLALAVDAGTELDGDAGTEHIDAGTLAWLLDHAHRFGWSWELQSEPWHLHYWAGDSIPQAVLDYEQQPAPPLPTPDPPPATDLEDAVYVFWTSDHDAPEHFYLGYEDPATGRLHAEYDEIDVGAAKALRDAKHRPLDWIGISVTTLAALQAA